MRVGFSLHISLTGQLIFLLWFLPPQNVLGKISPNSW